MPSLSTGFISLIASRRVVLCLVAWALHASCVASEREGIYLIDNDGETIQLSDVAATPGARLLVASPGEIAARTARPTRFAEIVSQAASAQRLAPELLHAVIAVESGYAVRAVSPRGAQGLMQLMPVTARAYGVTDPFDPRQNINAGAQHLRHLLDQFNQDTRLALAAYNAGAAAVLRYRHSIPPFAETVAYVPRVLQRLAQLQSPPLP